MCRRRGMNCIGPILALILTGWTAQPATAMDAVAVAGRPFGVGRITIPLDPTADTLIVDTNGYVLSEQNQRVFYPAVAHRRVLGLLRELIGVESSTGPATLTLYFLFQGDESLQLTLHTPQRQTLVVTPQYDPRMFRRLQRGWWQQFTAAARLQERQGDYPPIVETYLTRMLGPRLGLDSPLVDRVVERRPSLQHESLQLVLNIEAMRMRTMAETMRGEADQGPADQPLPVAIRWSERQALSVAAPAADSAPIEPIAAHVPVECFYLRFGSFDNYLWVRRFLEQNGGDASRLVTLRGHDALLNQRVQDQLGLRESALAELLGNQLISDVVLLGRDTYLREGAAIGILFEARNALLRRELSNQRNDAVRRLQASGATISDVTIEEQPVSLATTPGNELRSYYVVDGAYHLVTNSQSIVRRFLEAGQGVRPLSESVGFRQARADSPPHASDTLFAYLSPEFFRELVSPQYQIELRRRLRAVTDIEIVQLARLAARHEGLPNDRVEELVAARLLPDRFLDRPDGSQVIVENDRVSDSLRGNRGSFLPIPDVPITQVTAREATRFAEMVSFHERRWQDMDPLVLRLQRSPLAGTDRERVDVHAKVFPFERQKYGLVTSVIGPPTTTRIGQPADDAVTAQLSFQGGLLNTNIEPRHLFFGLRDEPLEINFSPSQLVRVMQVLRAAPAYFGAWPELGLLDLLPLREPLERDASGQSRLPFGLWQQSTPTGFSLVGVDPRVLADVADQLTVEEDDSQAQIRIHVMDVSQSKIQTWLAALDFQRAYQTSIGNTRLLHTIHQQLGVPVDETRQVAEQLLGVTLICALGGEYQLFDGPDELRYWGSTHWPSLLAGRPEGSGQFASPVLAWFRGLDAEIKLLDDRVLADATLDVQTPANGRAQLPFFNLWRHN